MISLRSKSLARLSLASLLVSVCLASSPGFASPQRLPVNGPWSSGDYVEAVFAVENGLITLPRQGNPKTVAFFDRLIDRSNVDIVMAAPLALEEKRRNILIILSVTGEFRGRYGYAVAVGDNVQGELVAIQIFRLYLIDQLATLDRQDDAERQRSANAIATTLSGTLDTLAQGQLFTTDQLLALSSALERHYPAIRTKLEPQEHQDILQRLKRMAEAEADPALKPALATALKAVRGGN